MSRRYSPPYYSPPRRGYGGRGRSPPPPPPRRGYGGGGRKGSSSGSLLVRNIPLDCRPEELRVAFERFGPVRDVYIPRDYYSGGYIGLKLEQDQAPHLLKPSMSLASFRVTVLEVLRKDLLSKFVDAYDAGEAQRSMNRRVFAGREITVVVASESRKRPEEMRVKTRTRSRDEWNLLALEVVLMDGLVHVHVQSLDHALPVVHQTLETGTDQGLSLLHQEEEEQTIQHLQGEDMWNVHGHHQEVLEEKKMENTVAGPIPLAMKVVLPQTRTEIKPSYEPEERRRGGRAVSRSPSGSRSRSAEASPR
ncbi:hypothetical protein Bca101_021352 [Brassica carinata]